MAGAHSINASELKTSGAHRVARAIMFAALAAGICFFGPGITAATAQPKSHPCRTAADDLELKRLKKELADLEKQYSDLVAKGITLSDAELKLEKDKAAEADIVAANRAISDNRLVMTYNTRAQTIVRAKISVLESLPACPEKPATPPEPKPVPPSTTPAPAPAPTPAPTPTPPVKAVDRCRTAAEEAELERLKAQLAKVQKALKALDLAITADRHNYKALEKDPSRKTEMEAVGKEMDEFHRQKAEFESWRDELLAQIKALEALKPCEEPKTPPQPPGPPEPPSGKPDKPAPVEPTPPPKPPR